MGEEATADKGGSPVNPEETDYEQDGYAAIAGAEPDRESGRLVENSQGGNDMKRMKKILAVLLAAIMVMSLGTSVFAEGTTYTITINTSDKDSSVVHTYEAYQIFAGTLSDDGTTLSDITWGTGVNASDLVTAINGITSSTGDYGALYEKFNTLTYAETNDTSAAAVAAVLTTLNESELEVFAKLVAANLTSTHTDSTETTNGDTYTITGLSAGYYLVKDKDNSLSSTTTDTAYTSYILKVVKNVTVDAKEDAPTLNKTIGTSDSLSTAAINDDITYTLTSSVPDMTGYSSYTFTITDTLAAGLAYNNDIKITIGGTDVTSESTLLAISPTSKTDGSTSTTITITFDSSEFLNAWTDKTYSTGSAIVITYSAKLVGIDGNDEDTAIDTGNASVTDYTNSAYLTYSNDPNSTGAGTSVTTTVETVTTTITVYKIDADEQKYIEALNGAVFTLTDGDNNTVGTFTVDSDNKGVYSFTGLDAGTYTLTETTAPDGYDAISPITFTLSYNEKEGWTSSNTTVSGTDSTGTSLNGNFVITIENNAGSSLPSTGGIGTTIFYVVGAILVLGAGVVLITRRRMASK